MNKMLNSDMDLLRYKELELLRKEQLKKSKRVNEIEKEEPTQSVFEKLLQKELNELKAKPSVNIDNLSDEASLDILKGQLKDAENLCKKLRTKIKATELRIKEKMDGKQTYFEY